MLNEPVWREDDQAYESPLDAESITLTPGAAEAVQQARGAGLVTIVVSNQPAAAKGSTSIESLRAAHARVLDLLAGSSASVDASYVCWHHPAGSVAALTVDCGCRKPKPGLLLQAARDLDLDLATSWLIGDTDADVGAASAAGLAGVVVVRHPRSAHRRGTLSEQAESVSDLPTAVAAVLRTHANCSAGAPGRGPL